ncbi:hypothetical protein JRQ81_007751, partial [Phrynocephalus forsythii]
SSKLGHFLAFADDLRCLNPWRLGKARYWIESRLPQHDLSLILPGRRATSRLIRHPCAFSSLSLTPGPFPKMHTGLFATLSLPPVGLLNGKRTLSGEHWSLFARRRRKRTQQ